MNASQLSVEVKINIRNDWINTVVPTHTVFLLLTVCAPGSEDVIEESDTGHKHHTWVSYNETPTDSVWPVNLNVITKG